MGQPSALLTRRARLHDSLGDLRVHGVLGYGSKHAFWLWSAPSPTFEQMMDGPSSAPELSGAPAAVAGDVGRQSEDSRRPPPAPGLCCSKTAAFESMKDEPNRRPRMRSSSAAVEWTSAGWRGDRWAPTPAPASEPIDHRANRQTSTPPRRTSYASSGADWVHPSCSRMPPFCYSTSQEPEEAGASPPTASLRRQPPRRARRTARAPTRAHPSFARTSAMARTRARRHACCRSRGRRGPVGRPGSRVAARVA